MCFPVSPAPQSLPSAARHPARPVSFHGPRFLSPPDTCKHLQHLCRHPATDALEAWRRAGQRNLCAKCSRCGDPRVYNRRDTLPLRATSRWPTPESLGGRAKPPGEVKNVASESKVISHAWLQRPRVVTKPRIMYHAWLVSAKVPLCHAWLDQPRVVHTFRICCHTWLQLLESCTTRGIYILLPRVVTSATRGT